MVFDPSALPGDNPVGNSSATTKIEIWKSASGISDADFSLLATVADATNGNPYNALDSPVISGQLYIYKARRLDQSTGLYSLWSPLAFVNGPFPRGTNVANTIVNSGMQAKASIGIETSPAQLVKATKAIELVSLNINGGIKRIDSKAIRNHPGIPRVVNGPSDYTGNITVEITPESFDEIASMYFGATSNTAVAAPAAPAAPTIAVVGTAGAVTYTYTVYATSSQGDSAASAAGTTTTGNATLSATNYNTVTWVPVQGAVSYKVLRGTAIIATGVQTLSLNDTGLASLGTYVAPAAPTGYQNAWNAGVAKTTATVAVQYGNSNLVRAFGGVGGNKMSIKFATKASEPLTASLDVEALTEINGMTLASLGLDVATYDPLPGYGIDSYCTAQIGGAIADAESFDVSFDRGLLEKRVLNGFAGPLANYLGSGKHKLTATLFFSSDAEKQRFYGVSVASGTSYAQGNKINVFPVTLTVTNPVNGAGVVNQFIIYCPTATYITVKEEIKGKTGIMQMVEIVPLLDPVTGTDIQLLMVNSRTATSIIPASPILVTGYNGGVINPISN